MIARPFVKSLGGKTRLLPDILARMPPAFRRYHEPFVGGGALFWALEAAGRISHGASIADANARLVRTYRGVKLDPGAVVRRLIRMSNTAEQFARTRARPPDDEDDDVKMAAWYVYLNKTAFNGIYRVNAANEFNAPFGRYASPAIVDLSNLTACSVALRRSKASIRSESFGAAIARAKEGDFVYADPPYAPADGGKSFAGYTSAGFGDGDQEQLRDALLAAKLRGVHVLASNSDVQLVRDLYGADFDVQLVAARRSVGASAGSRGQAAELLIS